MEFHNPIALGWIAASVLKGCSFQNCWSGDDDGEAVEPGHIDRRVAQVQTNATQHSCTHHERRTRFAKAAEPQT